IWERFVASQMTDARVRSLTFEITAGPAVFSATETQVIEQGFYRVLKMLSPKDLSKAVLPPTKEGEVVALHNVQSVQHFTQGPVRYTDASIVKMLEEKGIGRPSTYAPTISVLLDRYYVTRIQKQLMPTPLGKVISDLLTTYF
ncbi:DNA topoisomerase, partial [Treponema pallidum]